MKSQNTREKIFERLNFYSDRFADEGECGGRTTGCKSNDCETRKRHYTDKNLYHTYAAFYADEISSLANSDNEFSIMELGVAKGGSCAAWCESIENVFVCGVDWNFSQLWINPADYPNLKLLPGQHEIPETYLSLGDRKFDVIIDDGSHRSENQIANFEILRDRLKDNAIYVIEDVYPDNLYPSSFLSMFERVDFSNLSGRGDDVLLVYRKKAD